MPVAAASSNTKLWPTSPVISFFGCGLVVVLDQSVQTLTLLAALWTPFAASRAAAFPASLAGRHDKDISRSISSLSSPSLEEFGFGSSSSGQDELERKLSGDRCCPVKDDD